MKITKTYYYQYGNQYTSQVDYTTNTTPYQILTEQAQILINIPFKVSKIHIKNIAYVSGRNAGDGNTNVSNYVTFTSELVGNRPVGMVHRDSQFSMATLQDIEHTFQIPQEIMGYYGFRFYTNNGTEGSYNGTNTVYPFYFEEELVPPFPNIYHYWFDYFSITIEFNGENELI